MSGQYYWNMTTNCDSFQGPIFKDPGRRVRLTNLDKMLLVGSHLVVDVHAQDNKMAIILTHHFSCLVIKS